MKKLKSASIVINWTTLAIPIGVYILTSRWPWLLFLALLVVDNVAQAIFCRKH